MSRIEAAWEAPVQKAYGEHYNVPGKITDGYPFFPNELDVRGKLKRRSSWVEKEFRSHEASRLIPEPVLLWGTQVMRRLHDVVAAPKGLPEDDVRSYAERRVKSKVYHTKEVVQANADIIARTPDFEGDTRLAAIIAFLHDIARFPQGAFANTFIDHESFYHAEAGTAMIRKENLPFSEHDKQVIIDAIDNHSVKTPVVNDLYTRLIRDADKLALMRNPKHVTGDGSPLSKERSLSKISEAAKISFVAGETVDNKVRVTNADRRLSKLAWIFDINFSATRQLLLEEGIVDRLLQEVIDETDEIDVRIIEKVELWKREVSAEKEQQEAVSVASLPN